MNELENRIAKLESTVRRWRLGTILAAAMAVFALVGIRFRGSASEHIPKNESLSERTLKVERLEVEWLEVVDKNGHAVISMNEGAGGGILDVKSTKPHDHDVMIMASEFGASVQVSFQGEPRQFGFLKIMGGKPYVQLYEEAGTGTKNFYQAPLYFGDGTIGSTSNVMVSKPSSQPTPLDVQQQPERP